MDLVQCEYLPLPSSRTTTYSTWSGGVNNIYSYSCMTPSNASSSSSSATSSHPQLMMATDRAVFVVSPHTQKSAAHGLFEGKSRYGVEELVLSLPRDAQIISSTSLIRRSGAPLIAITLAVTSTSSTPSSATHANATILSSSSLSISVGSGSGTPSSGGSNATLPGRYLLHIYGARCTAAASLHDVSHDCQTMELSYTPFLLTHTNILHDRFDDLLVSGSDGNVHVFRQSNDPGAFSELTGARHPLPELTQLSSSVLSLDLGFDIRNARRVVAAGFQDGLVRLSSSPITTLGNNNNNSNSVINDIIISEHYLDGPAVSVRFFADTLLHSPLSQSCHTGAFASSLADDELSRLQYRAEAALHNAPAELHLLVGNALGFGVVYSNVLTEGLEHDTFLPHSDMSDSVLCTLTSDIDLDGRPELLLGTHGLSVMVYGADGGSGTSDAVHDAHDNNDRKDSHTSGLGHSMISHHSFPHPVYSLDSQCISGEGVDELVVTTMYAMQIMQWDWQSLEKTVMTKSELIADIAQLEAQLAAATRSANVSSPLAAAAAAAASTTTVATPPAVVPVVVEVDHELMVTDDAAAVATSFSPSNGVDDAAAVAATPAPPPPAVAAIDSTAPPLTVDSSTPTTTPIPSSSSASVALTSSSDTTPAAAAAAPNDGFDAAVLLSPQSSRAALAAATGSTGTAPSRGGHAKRGRKPKRK